MKNLSSPSGWRLLTLKDVAASIPNAIVDGPFGSNLKTDDYVASGVPVLQGKNITNDSFRWFDVRYVSEKKAEELKRSSVRPGDILIIKIGSIGYSAIVDALSGFEFAIIPANLVKMTPNADVVCTRYLHRWLTSPMAKNYLMQSASKTAQPALSLGKIKELPVPLPRLTEQRRIASILDKADALLIKRREALAQLDHLNQSIFIEIFGDPSRNPKGWPVRTLRELGKVSTGGTPPSGVDGMFGGEIPFITPGDLESNKPVKRSVTEAGGKEAGTVRAGGALVCCIGATIGKIGIATVRSSFNQQLNAVEWFPEYVDDEYGLTVLGFFKPTIIAWGASTTLPILKKSTFEKISIPVPPLALQKDFARRARLVAQLEGKLRVSLAEYSRLFSALQSRAFQGEL